MKYEQKIENLLRERIKDEVVLIPALKIKSTIVSMIYNKNVKRIPSKKMASGIAYISFIKTNQIKSLNEISDIFEVTRVDVGKTYKKIRKALGMNYCKKEEMSMMGTSCIIQRMPKDFLGKIKISEKSKKYAVQLLEKIEKNPNFQGKSPQVICAIGVYISLLMSGKFKTQREIADLCHVSESNLGKYKQIIEELEGKLKLEKLIEWQKKELTKWRKKKAIEFGKRNSNKK